MASVVAARIKKPAVTFSAPGVVLSRKKFNISLGDIDEYLVNIVPQGDLVSMIDLQGAKHQDVRCARDTVSIPCHYMNGTIEEIKTTCEGVRIRDVGGDGSSNSASTDSSGSDGRSSKDEISKSNLEDTTMVSSADVSEGKYSLEQRTSSSKMGETSDSVVE